MTTRKNRTARRHAVYLASALAALGVSSPLHAAPVSVSIGNGTQAADGSYLNAQKIANGLVATNITVQATSNIDIVDTIDLSTSPFGTPAGNLSLIAPTFNLNNNMNMSAFGNLFLTANAINLTGKITSGGNLISPARVTSTATKVNVLASTASIQQAIDFSSTTIHVNSGQYNENLSIAKSVTLESDSGAQTNSGQFHLTSSSATATIAGASFTNAAAGIIAGIGNLDVSGLSGSGFQNHGTVSPGLSPGILSITGAYSQASDGDLEIEIGGTTVGDQYDKLAVSGAANLDGLLHVSLIGGFTPGTLDNFTILTASGRSGLFSDAPTSIGVAGGVFDVSYTPTSVVLGNFHVPEPGTLSLFAFGSLAMLRRGHKGVIKASL